MGRRWRYSGLAGSSSLALASTKRRDQLDVMLTAPNYQKSYNIRLVAEYLTLIVVIEVAKSKYRLTLIVT